MVRGDDRACEVHEGAQSGSRFVGRVSAFRLALFSCHRYGLFRRFKPEPARRRNGPPSEIAKLSIGRFRRRWLARFAIFLHEIG